MTRRPTPPPLTKTERQALDDLIRRGARALNPAEGNRLLRLLELDHADRQQERRTAGGLMGQVQQLGGQLKDTTTRAEQAEASRDAAYGQYEQAMAGWNAEADALNAMLATRVPLICADERHQTKVRALEAQLAAVRALAEQLIATGCPWAGNVPGVGEDLLELLNSPKSPAAVKAMPLVPVSREDMEDWALGTPADPTAS